MRGKDLCIYSSHDLHAWPELYFQGVGWVRFEPTPASRTGGAPGYARPGALVEPALPSDTASAALPAGGRFNRPTPGSGGADRGATGTDSHGGGLGALPVTLLVVALVLLVLALPRLARAAVRRRRWARAGTAGELAEAAWDELRDSARDLGVAWDDTVSPRRRARDLSRAFGDPHHKDDALARSSVRGAAADPQAADALDRLVHRVERARFARDGSVGGVDLASARADTQACVSALRAGASRQQRTRATWLPLSLWGGPGQAGRLRARRTTMGAADAGVDHAV